MFLPPIRLRFSLLNLALRFRNLFIWMNSQFFSNSVLDASCREDVEVTVNRTASFDDRYQGSVIVDYTNAGEGLEWFETCAFVVVHSLLYTHYRFDRKLVFVSSLTQLQNSQRNRWIHHNSCPACPGRISHDPFCPSRYLGQLWSFRRWVVLHRCALSNQWCELLAVAALEKPTTAAPTIDAGICFTDRLPD